MIKPGIFIFIYGMLRQHQAAIQNGVISENSLQKSLKEDARTD